MNARIVRICLIVCLASVIAASLGAAKDKPPTGLLAASINNEVVLFDPASGMNTTISTGPIGWLFPAPGGILFAPDLVNSKTNVINLRQRRRVEVLDGVTMPHFGAFVDRYFAIGEHVLLVSYPGRAPIASVSKPVANPWQVEVPDDGSVILILSRKPDGEGGARLVAIDFLHRKLSYDAPLPGDITRIEVIKGLGAVAMVDAQSQKVHFVSPGTLSLMGSLSFSGKPIDVESYAEGRQMAIAFAAGEGAGPGLRLLKMKSGGEGIEFKKDEIVPLPSDPVGLAISPDGKWLGVALDDGQIIVLGGKKHEVFTTIQGPGEARDFIWVDPGAEGPIIEAWSDKAIAPVELEIDSWETSNN